MTTEAKGGLEAGADLVSNRRLDLDRYDDPALETEWLHEQQTAVDAYLEAEGVDHHGVAERPEWFVAPYLAVWGVRTASQSNRPGWWAVSGDVPTDYVTASEATDPRKAIRVFAVRWSELARSLTSGGSEAELAALLAERAAMLREIAADDDYWTEDDIEVDDDDDGRAPPLRRLPPEY